MIYRRRVRKTGYSVSLKRLHLKLEFGRHVLYVPFLGVGKRLHTLRSVVDRRGTETVTHLRRRERETVRRWATSDAYCVGYNDAMREVWPEVQAEVNRRTGSNVPNHH